ncbi:MAG TPA: aldose epimerase family protein [Methylophilaceae bacterium]|nr:aldose epimerase family protein [Methylophilaceae bacterium]
MPVSKQHFGTTHDGFPVECYSLSNNNGLEARIMTYGATLLSLNVPDRAGNFTDVILGFDTLEPYIEEHPYFGGIIGRYANRIARGLFRIDETTYRLSINNGPNHLHGGKCGFDRRIWNAHAEEKTTGPQLTLDYFSPHGEEGYPGNLQAEVRYTLTHENELRLDYRAETDAPTIINLTNHAYFNLAGKGLVLDHQLRLIAEHFLPVDETLIPTGDYAHVADTPMDFRRAAAIGASLDTGNEQLRRANGGYDHNWILTKNHENICTLAAEVTEPLSGRQMLVYTTQPGIQFYSGNFLDGTLKGKDGTAYEKHTGLCLETQHFPDSPNHPAFPSTLLKPAEFYQHTTVYRFGPDHADG